MATFKVTTPDGTYKVTAPNNATDAEVYAYLKTQLQEIPYTLVSGKDYGDVNLGSGQFFIEMIIGAVALGVIIALSKAHNLIWIPVVGFLSGYVIAQDASYAFSNVFGGLTFSLLCSFIAGVWIQRQTKKKKANK